MSINNTSNSLQNNQSLSSSKTTLVSLKSDLLTYAHLNSVNNNKPNRTKTFVKFVIFVSFATSILTSFGILALIIRLGLLNSQKLIELNPNGIVTINQDTVISHMKTDKPLRTSGITGDLTVGSDLRQDAPLICVNSNGVFLNALKYKFGRNESAQFDFYLPTKVKFLHAPEGIDNVKFVRSPSLSKDGLRFESSKMVKLSGNLGVDVDAANRIKLQVKDDNGVLYIKSFNSDIILTSNKGLFLDGLPIRQLEEINQRQSDYFVDSGSTKGLYQICICKNTGELFATRFEIDQEPCISASHC